MTGLPLLSRSIKLPKKSGLNPVKHFSDVGMEKLQCFAPEVWQNQVELSREGEEASHRKALKEGESPAASIIESPIKLNWLAAVEKYTWSGSTLSKSCSVCQINWPAEKYTRYSSTMSHTGCAHRKADQLIIAETFLHVLNTRKNNSLFYLYFLLAWESELFICMNISKVDF